MLLYKISYTKLAKWTNRYCCYLLLYIAHSIEHYFFNAWRRYFFQQYLATSRASRQADQKSHWLYFIFIIFGFFFFHLEIIRHGICFVLLMFLLLSIPLRLPTLFPPRFLSVRFEISHTSLLKSIKSVKLLKKPQPRFSVNHTRFWFQRLFSTLCTPFQIKELFIYIFFPFQIRELYCCKKKFCLFVKKIGFWVMSLGWVTHKEFMAESRRYVLGNQLGVCFFFFFLAEELLVYLEFWSKWNCGVLSVFVFVLM